jgi:hypothetical protein
MSVRAGGACGRPKAGLKCQSSSGDALSMKEGLVTDGEFFTRETWRSGKKFKLRKRVNNYAGRKTAPVEFLAAAKRAGFKPGRPGYRLCGAIKRNGDPCRRLAMRGCQGCESHGGIRALARRGEFQPSGRTALFKAVRATAIEDRTPAAPFELVQLELYRQANQWTRMRLIRAWGTSGWMALVRQIKSQRDI